jgi:trimeric autotransporter adhesin
MLDRSAKIVTRHKRTFAVLVFLILYSVGISFANPPTTKYQPGATLDPSCAPSSTNCSVQILPDQTSQAGRLLITDGTSTSWSSDLTYTAAGFTVTTAGAGIVFSGSGNHDITASSGTLRIGSNTIIGNIEALDSTVDIGTASIRFDKIYANEVNASTIVGTLTGGNLIAETFAINSDNATADTENSYLAFHRGLSSPNGVLGWDATNDEFDLNSSLHLTGTIASTNGLTLDGFTNDITTGTNQDLAIMPNGTGNVGIGDNSPLALLTVGSGDLFQVNSSGAIAAATGITTTGNVTLSTAPTTSAGTYDIVTRNSSTGVIEKIASTTYPSGSGTTNMVAKFTGTNTLGAGMIFDNGTNVGIGNTNTTYVLDVSGDMRTTGSAYLATTSGGNVGIRTTTFSPWSASNYVTIQGPSGMNSIGLAPTVGNGINMNTNAYYDGTTWRYAGTGNAATYGSFGSTHLFRSIGSSGVAGDPITWTTELTMTSTGATFGVPIAGTTAAFTTGSGAVAVSGGVVGGNPIFSVTSSTGGNMMKLDGAAAASSFMSFYSSSAIRGYLGASAGNLIFTGELTNAMLLRSEGAFQLGTNGNNIRMTVDTTGNVGIGDATPASLFTVGSGDLFQVNSSGAIAAATGIATTGNVTLSTAPTTSAGTYTMLTRNSSTGVVESIASTTYPSGSGAANQLAYFSGTNALTSNAAYAIDTTGGTAYLTVTGASSHGYIRAQRSAGTDQSAFQWMTAVAASDSTPGWRAGLIGDYNWVLQSVGTSGTWATRLLVNTAGEIQLGSTTDLGAFALQVTGNSTFVGTITSNGSGGTTTLRVGTSSLAGGVDGTAIGNSSSAAGPQSTAIGYSASAAGTGGIAIGRSAIAYNNYETAVGYSSVAGASGGGDARASAFGTFATASATFSTSIGGYSGATGANATAIGATAQSTATSSIALGANTSATHNYAIAIGDTATTTGTNQLVIGGSTAYINDVYIGKGVTHASPTAVTINANGASGADIAGASLILAGGKGTGSGAAGTILFKTSTPGASSSTLQSLATRLTVGGATYTGIDVAGTSYFGGSSIVGNVARFENSTGTCDINPTTSTLSCSSDMRLKKNITTLDGESFALKDNYDGVSILEKILTLTPVTYNWTRESSGDASHIGFIAQELEAVFPKVVSTDPTTGLKSVGYTSLIPYTIKAIQEMNVRIAMLPEFEDPTLVVKIADFLRGIAERGEALVDSVKTKKVQTEQLCVGNDDDEVCITKEQLRDLLMGSSSGTVSGPISTESTDPVPPAEEPTTTEPAPTEETATPPAEEPIAPPSEEPAATTEPAPTQ